MEFLGESKKQMPPSAISLYITLTTIRWLTQSNIWSQCARITNLLYTQSVSQSAAWMMEKRWHTCWTPSPMRVVLQYVQKYNSMGSKNGLEFLGYNLVLDWNCIGITSKFSMSHKEQEFWLRCKKRTDWLFVHRASKRVARQTFLPPSSSSIVLPFFLPFLLLFLLFCKIYDRD